jgi:hypothetical protein
MELTAKELKVGEIYRFYSVNSSENPNIDRSMRGVYDVLFKLLRIEYDYYEKGYTIWYDLILDLSVGDGIRNYVKGGNISSSLEKDRDAEIFHEIDDQELEFYMQLKKVIEA